jgi:hypothetical protein
MLLNNQQRKFSYIRLNTKNYIDEVKVNPESVREFFDENKQAFLEPQKVKVDYLRCWLFNDCIRFSADGVTNAESKILNLI